MSNLEDLTDSFEYIVEIAYDLSQKFDGVDTDDIRKKVSTYYLAKIVPECISLLKILPWSSHSDPEDFFDFSSFCSLCRNVVEGCNLHWYYCVDEIDVSEVEFRFMLYDYHEYTTYIKLERLFAGSEDDLAKLESRRHKLRLSLESHPFFSGLSQELKRSITKGRKCAHLSHSEISERRALDSVFFDDMYKLLSNAVHSTPSGISTVVHTRIYGKELEQAFAGLLLTYVPAFVADMVRTIGAMWGFEFAKAESEDIINQFSLSLYGST